MIFPSFCLPLSSCFIKLHKFEGLYATILVSSPSTFAKMLLIFVLNNFQREGEACALSNIAMK